MILSHLVALFRVAVAGILSLPCSVWLLGNTCNLTAIGSAFSSEFLPLKAEIARDNEGDGTANELICVE